MCVSHIHKCLLLVGATLYGGGGRGFYSKSIDFQNSASIKGMFFHITSACTDLPSDKKTKILNSIYYVSGHGGRVGLKCLLGDLWPRHVLRLWVRISLGQCLVCLPL